MKQKAAHILCFIMFVGLLLLPAKALSQVDIWQGTSVHHRVELTPYIATGNRNVSVIVCPGGSYFWHDLTHEGEMVGRWLQSKGINAFVLRYRTAYVPAFLFRYRLFLRGNRYPDALNDLRQAMNYIRRRADSYHVDTCRIGVMGFSAGGHLAMCSVELLPKAEWPAFLCLAYPVVTMSHPCVHKRSRRGLLGENHEHNALLCHKLSMEEHVPAHCPPTFLMNCKDDPIVNRHNAELLDSAMTAKGVPHCFVQYNQEGHGFGASETKGTAECRQWRERFMLWLRQMGILTAQGNVQ